MGKFTRKSADSGFTIIELLVTLFVAAIFLIAGYQIYTTVIRTDGQTKAQVIAQNTAQDYLERYRTSVPSPCVASTPLTNSPITVAGLVNVTISVTVSCPKSGAISTLSKIDVLLQYGNQSPQAQIAYSAWSYSQDACGAGYIIVPADSRFDTPTFCVMKYEAKNVNGQAVSQAAGTPWVNISQNDAVTVSAAACPTCHLISDAEWMAVAANVLGVGSNWSGGSVGSGYIYSGHNDNISNVALAATTDDSQGYYGETSPGANQKRTLTLSNGEIIWDLAGNVWEWTNNIIPGGQQPGLAGESSVAWKEWNNSALLWGSLPAISRPRAISSQAAGWSSTQGIGGLASNYGDTVDRGFLRGGGFNNGGMAGVLAMALNTSPSDGTTNGSVVGFRVAKSVDSQPEQLTQPASCPTGFIPVPGDARFGTIGFCVMKYEAKNVSGVATSQAAGTPWANITQAQAITQSQLACPGCHLISEAEWMTIAANVMSVASNWSGGAVGSGYIYSGHNDAAPANTLAADTNDANGYAGETNTGGNQRRTLTLNNGQVIWDLAGNIAEYTNDTIAGGLQPGLSGESASYAWKEWNNTSLLMNGLPTVDRPVTAIGSGNAQYWTTNKGIGALLSDYGETASHVYNAGGNFGDTVNAGVLSLRLDLSSSYAAVYFGFRAASDEFGPVSVPAQVLVVAGGGGGGRGGGGGAGGLIYTTSIIYPGESYAVTVGAGGAGSSTNIGSNGGNSVFNGLTAIGGGGGGGNGNTTAATPGNSGGSGGGGGLSVTGTDGAAGGSGTPGQGNAGGYGTAASCSPSGGGGGAGAAGGAGVAGSKAGDGGTGIAISITGTSIYYGGGGGGASWCLGQGAGGNGGGGAGAATSGTAGTANTGGGGGGGAGNPSGGGASGGSGVVIIRYPTGSMTATGGTITTSGGYTIHKFTSSGTFTVQ